MNQSGIANFQDVLFESYVAIDCRLRLVDPDLRAALAVFPDLSGLSGTTLAETRKVLAGSPQPLNENDAVEVRAIEIAGMNDAPPIPALLYRPRKASAALPALLNIHGGGYVAGDIWREHANMVSLCEQLGCLGVSINYRLAPETLWPGPSDDCLAALDWLHQEARNLGIDPARVAVRGVSAGGGLAAGLALRTSKRADLPIALLMLIYPMLDDRTGPAPHTGEHVWTAAANAYGWSAFLGAVGRPPPPEAVPARAMDLSGLPPTFIAVGSIDLFAQEDLTFAQRLIAAGVPTETHVYPGGFHGFNLIPDASLSRAFARDCVGALARAFKETER